MDKVRVSRIRPVSWNIYVQGESEARYARSLLSNAGVHTSNLERQPDLTEPPIFKFLATPDEALPMTSDELEALLDRDERVELAFEKAQRRPHG